eukprot:51181-Pelagomonas_calceolata.AAC.1
MRQSPNFSSNLLSHQDRPDGSKSFQSMIPICTMCPVHAMWLLMPSAAAQITIRVFQHGLLPRFMSAVLAHLRMWLTSSWSSEIPTLQA